MVNHLVIQGRITADIELRKTQSDVSVCSFTVAWNEKFKDIDRTCFQKCKAWRGTAEFIDKYFHEKGSVVIVEGHLETEKWDDKDGNHRQENVLTVDKAHFAGSKGAPKPDGAGGTFTPTWDDDQLPF